MRGGQRSVAILAVLAVLALGLSLLHNSGASVPVESIVTTITTPVRSAFTAVASGVSGWFGDLGRSNELRDENDVLRARVAELETSLTQLRDIERENAALREALAYGQSQPSFDLVTTQVVGMDSVGTLNTLLLDRGASSGIRVGMAVIARGGLIGRVTAVTDVSAEVLPVLDTSSSVNVVTDNPRYVADGIVDGDGEGQLIMRKIEALVEINEGDVVVTSGLGGSFPRGIPVGRVATISTLPSSVFREAIIEPFVPYEGLYVVQVVIGRTGAT